MILQFSLNTGYGKKIMNDGKKAFTLVELLVVISIIALLLSILYPVIAKARIISKQLICSTNLSHVAKVIILYSADNNGDIIIASEMQHSTTLEGFHSAWHIALMPYIGQEIEKNPLENYAKLWICPSDKDPYPRGHLNSPHEGMTSYGLNGYSSEKEHVNYKPDIPLKLGPAGGFEFSQVSQGSACMLMGETSYASQFYDVDSDKTRNHGMREEGHHRMTSGFYHDGRMNILYVDGHVDNIRGKKCLPDNNYYPSNYATKNYAFWKELRLPTADEKPSFWGPGY